MASVLAVTWDGGGNVPPMLGIAQELRTRGHQVRVLGHPQQRESVTRAGLEFVSYRRAQSWSPQQAATGLRFLLRFLFRVFTDPGAGDDVRAELAAESVDVVLVDSIRLGACAPLNKRACPMSW